MLSLSKRWYWLLLGLLGLLWIGRAAVAATPMVSLGYQHSVALRSDGTVVAWGDNGYGQLGIPAGLTNVIAIAAGGYFNLALIGDGPPNPSSSPLNASWSSNVFHISLPSRNNFVYRLESKNDLPDPTWRGFPLVPGTGAVLNFADPSATGIQRFYRVRRW